jgi:hypothetical protein
MLFGDPVHAAETRTGSSDRYGLSRPLVSSDCRVNVGTNADVMFKRLTVADAHHASS